MPFKTSFTVPQNFPYFQSQFAASLQRKQISKPTHKSYRRSRVPELANFRRGPRVSGTDAPGEGFPEFIKIRALVSAGPIMIARAAPPRGFTRSGRFLALRWASPPPPWVPSDPSVRRRGRICLIIGSTRDFSDGPPAPGRLRSHLPARLRRERRSLIRESLSPVIFGYEDVNA